jgi:hypothetical protein
MRIRDAAQLQDIFACRILDPNLFQDLLRTNKKNLLLAVCSKVIYKEYSGSFSIPPPPLSTQCCGPGSLFLAIPVISDPGTNNSNKRGGGTFLCLSYPGHCLIEYDCILVNEASVGDKLMKQCHKSGSMIFISFLDVRPSRCSSGSF